ncbi:MAG: F0F1 ATP synthase subunit A [Acidimicrobiia bacterium]
MIAALFPNGINELFDWRAIFGEGSIWAFNKTAALALFSTAICLFVFVIGGRKRALVPTGLQNVAEAGYEFVEKQIAEPVIGGHHGEGKKWAPYLGVLFFFILFMNIWSTVPPIQFPATSRIAIPIILSLSVWVAFIFAGFKAQGPLYPIKTCAPSGVPKALLPLVFIIEFFSKFLVRPLSLSVRLFANMLAGHVLISVFAIMTNELVVKHPSGVYQIPIGILPFVMLVFMTIFELLVAFLQAYIFITLAAVYIGDSISTDH